MPLIFAFDLRHIHRFYVLQRQKKTTNFLILANTLSGTGLRDGPNFYLKYSPLQMKCHFLMTFSAMCGLEVIQIQLVSHDHVFSPRIEHIVKPSFWCLRSQHTGTSSFLGAVALLTQLSGYRLPAFQARGVRTYPSFLERQNEEHPAFWGVRLSFLGIQLSGPSFLGLVMDLAIYG